MGRVCLGGKEAGIEQDVELGMSLGYLGDARETCLPYWEEW